MFLKSKWQYLALQMCTFSSSNACNLIFSVSSLPFSTASCCSNRVCKMLEKSLILMSKVGWSILQKGQHVLTFSIFASSIIFLYLVCKALSLAVSLFWEVKIIIKKYPIYNILIICYPQYYNTTVSGFEFQTQRLGLTFDSISYQTNEYFFG